jgi:micrococcal nuclease
MNIKVLVSAFSLILGTTATTSQSTPSIIYFYDGDTVKINDGDLSYKLRISDIDAPELQQVYGKNPNAP